MILCDTNILIEIYRNNSAIDAIVDTIGYKNIAISDVTRTEILAGARNKKVKNTNHKVHKGFSQSAQEINKLIIRNF
jgi:predicted nucleic acid-binding protein